MAVMCFLSSLSTRYCTPSTFQVPLFLARYQLSIGVLHLQDLLPSRSNCGSFSLLSTAVLYTEIVR
jgi:hypothetical protein